MSVLGLTSQNYGGSGKVFPSRHIGASNSRQLSGHGVMASLDADATIELETQGLPATAPAGTLKAVIESYAIVAATQSAFLRLLWVARTAGENFDTQTLNDEHAAGDLEIEHTTADNDEGIITKVVLDADTITYGTDYAVRVHLDLKNTSWDLAVQWVFKAYLIWE